MIEVERAGALTTVQDLGRPGHAASGVPRGGAFDPWAARLANRLVGNPDHAALLEITLVGPTIVVHRALRAALVGDPFEIEVENPTGAGQEPSAAPLRNPDGCAWGQAKGVQLGDKTKISIGRVRSGVRAWLAFEGGLDLPVVLGSRSTDLAGEFGGHSGRALQAGDRLLILPSLERARPSLRRERVRADALPERDDEKGAERELPPDRALRILPGPDRELTKDLALASLAREPWRVEPNSDRRGVRLAGGAVALRPHEPLRSRPTLPGAVQATPSGELVVLGVDAPVTGGYPWIAQVIEADLGRIAHLAPGASVRFEAVGLDEAERALAERWAELERSAAEAER